MEHEQYTFVRTHTSTAKYNATLKCTEKFGCRQINGAKNTSKSNWRHFVISTHKSRQLNDQIIHPKNLMSAHSGCNESPTLVHWYGPVVCSIYFVAPFAHLHIITLDTRANKHTHQRTEHTAYRTVCQRSMQRYFNVSARLYLSMCISLCPKSRNTWEKVDLIGSSRNNRNPVIIFERLVKFGEISVFLYRKHAMQIQ